MSHMQKLKTFTTLLLGIVVALGGRIGAQPHLPAPAQRPMQPVVLASTIDASDRGPRQITVWRRDYDRPPSEKLREYYRVHPDGSGFPNVVLYASDSSMESPSNGRTAWMAYDQFPSNAQPWPYFSADVVVHPLTKVVYVALLKSSIGDATLSLYELSREASVAPHPLNLSLDTIERWPEASKPIATFKKQLGRPGCDVASVRLAGTPDGLMAVALPSLPGCPPAYAEYNSASKTWRDVTIAPPR